MRITEKILLVFLPTFMLSVATMTLFSRRAAEQVLTQDVARGGRALSVNLAQSQEMVTGFRTGDERLLLPPLQQVQENTGAEYAMVLGPDRRVLAHTNVLEKGKVFDDEVSRRAVASSEPVQAEMEIDERRVMDIAFPVWELDATEEGEEFLLLGHRGVKARQRLGTIRLGLPLAHALDTADRISSQVLWIVTLVNVLAMGVSLFYVRKMLRPVRIMARATERIATGQLGETVPILSRDEVGDLAHSFNRMSQELAMTTVSVGFLDSILDNMRDVLVVTNADGSVRRVNRAALGLLGYEEADLIGRSASHLFAAGDDLFGPENLIDLTRQAGVLGRESVMSSRTGRAIPVLVSVAPFSDRAGSTAGFIVTAADITDRKRAEERIRQSLVEKEILLKEIHHRVKNNLQIISSLLNLQSGKVEDAQVHELFSDSQNRIKTMALIHEKLYQSQDLERVDFREYIQSLAVTLYQSYRGSGQDLTVEVEVDEGVLLGIDQAIPCGLIINELMSNSLKHAFPGGGRGKVFIRFRVLGSDRYRLMVGDDGRGLPESVDVEHSDSLGLKLVLILVRQLHGGIRVSREGGTEFCIDFGAAVAEQKASAGTAD